MKLTKKELKELDNIEHIFLTKAKSIGNGAMLSVSKKYLGQECVVAVLMNNPKVKD